MKYKQTTIWLMIMFVSGFTACSQGGGTTVLFEKPGYKFPYHLSEPVKTWKVPADLLEISGMAYIDNQRLACVQDELGRIYIFNLQSGEVESEIDFSKEGDYEGIEIIEKDAWVLKSNGMLFKIADVLGQAVPVVEKFKTALSGKNDTEGLGYDPVSKNLLIACKENPFIDDEGGSGFKAIYRFSTETKELDLKPFLLIDKDTIGHYKGDESFKPSGLAIHPKTGHVFILGSAGKLLLVYSAKGDLLAIVNLSPQFFPQPEGICFSPDGTLFISNEGAGRAGTILRFDPKNK